jgi:hypothetical protein
MMIHATDRLPGLERGDAHDSLALESDSLSRINPMIGSFRDSQADPASADR